VLPTPCAAALERCAPRKRPTERLHAIHRHRPAYRLASSIASTSACWPISAARGSHSMRSIQQPATGDEREKRRPQGSPQVISSRFEPHPFASSVGNRDFTGVFSLRRGHTNHQPDNTAESAADVVAQALGGLVLGGTDLIVRILIHRDVDDGAALDLERELLGVGLVPGDEVVAALLIDCFDLIVELLVSHRVISSALSPLAVDVMRMYTKINGTCT
jgi:hypothetical protein